MCPVFGSKLKVRAPSIVWRFCSTVNRVGLSSFTTVIVPLACVLKASIVAGLNAAPSDPPARGRFARILPSTALSTTIIGVAAIVTYYLYPPVQTPVLTASLGLQLGGAVGNMVDRLMLGYVTDFLDFRVWPVFNIADSAIVVGVAVLTGYMLLFDKPAKAPVKGAKRGPKKKGSIAEPSAVLLEIEGSLKLFNGLSPLYRRIRDGLKQLGLDSVMACAPTPLAAQLFACAGLAVRIQHRDALRHALGHALGDDVGEVRLVEDRDDGAVGRPEFLQHR